MEGPLARPHRSVPVRSPCFRRGNRWGSLFAGSVTVGCCLVLLLSSTPLVRAEQSGNPPPPAGTTQTILDYLYNVSPRMYPAAAYMTNVSSPHPISLVQLLSLPSPATSYGMANVSTNTSGASQLWFSQGGYAPLIAESLYTSTCKQSLCPSIPLHGIHPFALPVPPVPTLPTR